MQLYKCFQPPETTWRSRTLQGFLYHFRDLTREQMMKSAKDLEIHALISCDNSSDIPGYMLAEERIAFRNIRSTIPDSVTGPTHILTPSLKRSLLDDFPDYWVALKILCTIPVTVAPGERSSSKLTCSHRCARYASITWQCYQLKIDIAQILNYDDVIDSCEKITMSPS
jgi:hypothetical protein